MALNTNKNLKLYYSIKEVAQMIGVRECTLRYWETEFPHLKPKTTGQKVRQYTEKDIEQIKLIYNLVKVRGFKKDDKPEPHRSRQERRCARHAHICARPVNGPEETDRRTYIIKNDRQYPMEGGRTLCRLFVLPRY